MTHLLDAKNELQPKSSSPDAAKTATPPAQVDKPVRLPANPSGTDVVKSSDGQDVIIGG